MKKRLKIKNIRQIMITIIFVVIAVAIGIMNQEEALKLLGIEATNSLSKQNEIPIENHSYIVQRVVDGDTFEIEYEGRKQKVRLIGIDTPESVHPDKKKNQEAGKTASEYVKKILENKIVTLEFDIQSTDKYGRLLAYVYLPDGEMLNKKLLKEGYAKIATYPPNVKYVEEFTKIQEQARSEKRGFWSKGEF